MVRLVRSAVIAFLAVLVAVVCAVPSSAADGVGPSQQATVSPYGCLSPLDSYGAPQVCQLAVHVISPICDKDVPKLKYDIAAIGSPNTTVTITFLNPGGQNVVYPNLPLAGTVLWPGAVVGPDGRGIDWPGWRQLPDGSWVEGDQYDWVRPSVKVLFQVNPEATVTVAYPPSSPTCLTSPPGEEVLAEGDVVPASNTHQDPTTTAVLSATGSNDAPLLYAALGFVVIGAAAVTLVAIARRRKGQDA